MLGAPSLGGTAAGRSLGVQHGRERRATEFHRAVSWQLNPGAGDRPETGDVRGGAELRVGRLHAERVVPGPRVVTPRADLAVRAVRHGDGPGAAFLSPWSLDES